MWAGVFEWLVTVWRFARISWSVSRSARAQRALERAIAGMGVQDAEPAAGAEAAVQAASSDVAVPKEEDCR
jgi:hypothetical protein